MHPLNKRSQAQALRNFVGRFARRLSDWRTTLFLSRHGFWRRCGGVVALQAGAGYLRARSEAAEQESKALANFGIRCAPIKRFDSSDLFDRQREIVLPNVPGELDGGRGLKRRRGAAQDRLRQRLLGAPTGESPGRRNGFAFQVDGLKSP